MSYTQLYNNFIILLGLLSNLIIFLNNSALFIIFRLCIHKSFLKIIVSAILDPFELF